MTESLMHVIIWSVIIYFSVYSFYFTALSRHVQHHKFCSLNNETTISVCLVYMAEMLCPCRTIQIHPNPSTPIPSLLPSCQPTATCPILFLSPEAVHPGSQQAQPQVNPFTAEVAIMRRVPRLSAKVAFVRPEKEEQSDWLVWPYDSFIDLGYLYCKQMQRAFNVFKNTLNWLKIDSVNQKFNWLECGNFSQDAGMPGTERVIAFSQLAVKGLNILAQTPKSSESSCWRR
jgi:hypothetical protein